MTHVKYVLHRALAPYVEITSRNLGYIQERDTTRRPTTVLVTTVQWKGSVKKNRSMLNELVRNRIIKCDIIVR